MTDRLSGQATGLSLPSEDCLYALPATISSPHRSIAHIAGDKAPERQFIVHPMPGPNN